MIKANTNVAQLNTVSAVLPITNLGALGEQDHQQALISQLVKGKVYLGEIAQQVSDTRYLVKLQSDQAAPLMLSMDLDRTFSKAETLSLTLLTKTPTLTFSLKTPLQVPAQDTVSLSQTAHHLAQYVAQAEDSGVSKQYVAHHVVSQFPLKPELMAQDLSHAVSNTGLFYESHLQAFAKGEYVLSQIQQEPQNQKGFSVDSTLFQQLAILENQRLSWHGEIWSGQAMTWDIYQQSSKQSSLVQSEHHAIASELTIDFPHLGKVKVKLSMAGEHLNIHVLSTEESSYRKLQLEKVQLLDVFQQRGQRVDSFIINHDDK